MNPYSKNRRAIDKLTGFQVGADFEQFEQKNEIYCRAEWDAHIGTKKALDFFKGYFMPNARARKTDGFSQRDYALRNAAWHVTNVLRDINRNQGGRKEGFFDHFSSHEEGWPEPYPYANDQEATSDVRKVAMLAGADIVGFCAFDDRWMYKTLFDDATKASKNPDMPGDLNNVIVVGESMDEALSKTVPSALSGAATGLGYSYDSLTLLTLAQYIRNLGYRAYATMNDTSLAIPLAVQAGLGEVGRHSLLITEEYGPRLRLGRVFTDLPLKYDKPKHFGIKEFCEQCDRCANECPPKAIPFGKQTTKIHNRSNLVGVKKWTVDAEKCFKFWANQNTDCSICIRVCPFNRDFSKWYNRLWRKLASSSLRRFALFLDDRFVNRGRYRSSWWWARASHKS